ncbi:daunorubicin resistance ABC transporter ATP-binding subunit [Mycobacteroides abscessus subsp. abscessus]|nr:daunorubicin resistance ABC transporter ATP-binding subunit [Mycobacteroides abscessus subsp. abscessus]
MDHVIRTLDIGPLLDKPVRKLSLGQRMRCELAAALIHNPPLLFLDEPTIGLDVLVKLKIREFLKEINHDLPVEWQRNGEDEAFTAFAEDKEEVISALIARAVSAYKVRDIKIMETSTEEIIRNIYDKGMA